MSADAKFRPRRTDAEIVERFRAKGPPPGASTLLGFELTAVNQAEQRVEAAFTATPQLLNPLGQVQGGMLTAMLDEVMSVAAVVSLGFTHVVPSLEIKTSYLRPVGPGRITGEGRVVRLGRNVAFLEGRLYDADGKLVATATATAMLVARPPRAK
jgi:uncharacterized protein (TIGR00369 family)